MIASKLAKRLRRMADELEEPILIPTFCVKVSVVDLSGSPSESGMVPAVTAYQVFVSDGTSYEGELPALPVRSRILVQVVKQ